MSAANPRRRRGPILGSVLLLASLATWFVATTGDTPVVAPTGSVTVRPTAAPPAAAPPVIAEPLLTPPTPPSLPEAVAAAPDAFVGAWRAADGQRLHVTATGSDRYGVTVGGEQYDGVLRDGRVHFPRGIDGEWLQATAAGDCLLLGSGTRFCR